MRSRRQGGRRGNAMLVGLSLGVLLGFSALTIDIGMIRVARSQLQAAIDAATVSGASELDGTPDGIERAKVRAREIAGLNGMLDTFVDLPIEEVEVGTYDSDTDVFTLWDDDPLTAGDVNAVRIEHSPPPIGSALGGVAFGAAGYGLTARSLGIRSRDAGTAVSTSCFLPLAIPDCWIADTPPGTNPAPFQFQLTSSNEDAIAWGDPDGNPNTNDVRAQLEGQCDQGTIEVGDPIYVNEGSHTSALQSLRDILNGAAAVAPTQWDSALYGPQPARPAGSAVMAPNWGNVLEGPVAIVDAGSDCANVSFTGSLAMTGVAWAVIFDVKDTGGTKYVQVQLDLVNEHEIWGEIDVSETGNVLGTDDPKLVRF